MGDGELCLTGAETVGEAIIQVDVIKDRVVDWPMVETPQRIPASWEEREALRRKGQFWTPAWIADAMIAYGLAGGCSEVFDPAVGAGAFLCAAKRLGEASATPLVLSGCEIDPSALREALANGLTSEDLAGVRPDDFVLHPPQGRLEFVVANPPYIRHHRLPPAVKDQLRSMALSVTGREIDGRAGLHVYFLIRALSLLADRGRLAFIVPADTVEGVFARRLWAWIAGGFCLDAVITFMPEASPFPGVDTNPLILMIRKRAPQDAFWWVKCNVPAPVALVEWVLSGFAAKSTAMPGLTVIRRRLGEGLDTGLSREPCSASPGDSPVARLGDYARVIRGIATGDNDYFHMTLERARLLGIPAEFLVRAVARTRDVPGDVLAERDLAVLDRQGRPTVLFSPDGKPIEDFPDPVRRYLMHGERLGLPKRPLLASRRPWYRMEIRYAPPFLFAYLGRRNARFIRNWAGAVPLTGFLCVYPRAPGPDAAERLWAVLRHPRTLANIPLVGKSYGRGAIKVEPRALETLPIPSPVLEEAGLPLPFGATIRTPPRAP
ncbi:MAG: N-6 DNA methylase [Ignavibacteriales bacterium]